ncbi:hypothetical protein TURU_020624 [Turdus rufiventris]|nr:hypothetical protein TURU_020624 [Turdus rufiventris]
MSEQLLLRMDQNYSRSTILSLGLLKVNANGKGAKKELSGNLISKVYFLDPDVITKIGIGHAIIAGAKKGNSVCLVAKIIMQGVQQGATTATKKHLLTSINRYSTSRATFTYVYILFPVDKDSVKEYQAFGVDIIITGIPILEVSS